MSPKSALLCVEEAGHLPASSFLSEWLQGHRGSLESCSVGWDAPLGHGAEKQRPALAMGPFAGPSSAWAISVVGR